MHLKSRCIQQSNPVYKIQLLLLLKTAMLDIVFKKRVQIYLYINTNWGEIPGVSWILCNLTTELASVKYVGCTK